MQMLQQAYDLHRRGAYAQAEALYAAVVKANPQHVDALYLFGVLRLQQERIEEALLLLEKASKHRARAPEILSAIVAGLSKLGRHEEALTRVEELIAATPGDPDAHFNRGVVLAALARNEEAVASYRRALSLRPNQFEAWFNLGTVLAALRRPGEALDCYNRVIGAAPHHQDLLTNRGNVLAELGRNNEAIADYDRVIAINPKHVAAINNRARALKTLGRLDEALAGYERVLAIEPSYVDALYNRGNTLLDMRRLQDAEADFRKAASLRPGDADIHVSLSVCLLEQRRPKESIERYRHALALRPHDAKLHSDLIFAMNFDPDGTIAEQQAERTRWHQSHGRAFAETIRPWRNGNEVDRRLRIGYVSSHFRHQAATYSFGGVITHHDRNAFDVFCYSDTRQMDDVTERLRACATTWRDTASQSDEELAELIRSDRIDVLVDAVGHMQGHRLLVFARKPAPVQVTAWGEPTGTGLETMDYLFADRVLVPKSERPLFAETVVDLPNFLTYWVPGPLPEVGPSPAQVRGYVTFGSFNRLLKLLDPVLSLWAAILRAVPGSRLVLKDRPLDHPGERAAILAFFEREGITADRLTLLGLSDREEHFTRLNEIDIALDPFPHGGGATTLDALYMGVPVITCAGPTVSARLAAACLSAIGLTDFVALDRDAYLALAVSKAQQLDALADLRQTMRARLAATPVGDPARYTRAVEKAYCEMWRRYVGGVSLRSRH